MPQSSQVLEREAGYSDKAEEVSSQPGVTLCPSQAGWARIAARGHEDRGDQALFSKCQQLTAFLQERPEAREAGRLGAFL